MRGMMETGSRRFVRVLPWLVLVAGVVVWAAVCATGMFPPSMFPAPRAVLHGFREEVNSGRLYNDVVASLFRVGVGFGLAVILGIPIGISMGHRLFLRAALAPAMSFLRNLSPLAWMPFAILWFGIGDVPAIFLIFLASFFPMILATTASVASVPAVYYRVARDHGMRGWALVARVTLPAILPQVITALRVTAGIAWVVVVAAEMIAGRDGLGFAIMDARNGLRTDIVVVEMIVIGVIGIVIDRALFGLTKIPSARWGYER